MARDRDRGRDRDVGRDRERDRDMARDRGRDKDVGRDRNRDMDRDRNRNRDMDRDRGRDVGRDRERESGMDRSRGGNESWERNRDRPHSNRAEEYRPPVTISSVNSHRFVDVHEISTDEKGERISVNSGTFTEEKKIMSPQNATQQQDDYSMDIAFNEEEADYDPFEYDD